MPAPTQFQIFSAIVNALPASYKSGPAHQKYPEQFNPATNLHNSQFAFVTQLSSDLARAWALWLPTLKFGGIPVVGAGLGTWTGVGQGGGAFLPSILAFNIGLPPSFQITTANTVLRQAIGLGTIAKFTNFIAIYKTSDGAIQYFGGSSATPIASGVFEAVSLPISLIAAKSPASVLMPPATVANLIMGSLAGTNPSMRDSSYYFAYANALDALFNIFLGSSLNSNSVTGPSVAITGAGASASLPDGTIT